MNAPVRKPVWCSLPVDDGAPLPRLDDGDSYIVRLANGTELWAVYVVGNGAWFYPCDDEGNEVGDALDNVVAVMTSGYRKGFGPSCPVAGEAPRIHLVVASPAIVKIIDQAQKKARELLGESFGAAS